MASANTYYNETENDTNIFVLLPLRIEITPFPQPVADRASGRRLKLFRRRLWFPDAYDFAA